jgi:2-octaprenyl-6-methoxyphenol hydroxylase
MTERRTDILVVGMGAAGLVAALALTRDGARVTLAGRPDAPPPGRTVALFAESIERLERLAVWPALRSHAAPLRRLRVIDATDNLFRWRPVTFKAEEIGLDAFGFNVTASALAEALLAAARAENGLDIVEGLAEAPRFGAEAASVVIEGRERIEAKLIVAADGRQSPLRRAAGISVRKEAMRQAALIAVLDHEVPHGDTSTEFHLRGGPCTLVPLGPGRSSLVWMARRPEAERLAALDDEAFAGAVEEATGFMLGAMRVAGSRALVPLASLHGERLAARRLVLVGEAAHAFPPIGAQGLNLGMRDAAAIAALVGEALRAGEDVGGPTVTEAYGRTRRLDVATRSAAVSLMNASLLTNLAPVDLARGLGMAALDLLPPLRRLVMREGVAPGFGGDPGNRLNRSH